MSLLDKLKSLLGLDETNEEPRQDVGVTVERDVDESAPATDTERAVKGTDIEPTDESVEESTAEDIEADATEKPESGVADGSTDEDEPIDEDELIDEAEPDEGVEPEAEPETEQDAEPEPETEQDAEPEPETEETGTEPDGDLEDIKGVGPAYAERLADAGIETIGDLAAADAGDIAAETDLSETRVENWIEQAKLR